MEVVQMTARQHNKEYELAYKLKDLFNNKETIIVISKNIEKLQKDYEHIHKAHFTYEQKTRYMFNLTKV